MEEWQASRPVTLDGKLPAPQIDVNKVDPALIKKLQERDGVFVEAGTAMRPEDKDKIRAGIEARRLAREARAAERLKQSIEKRKEEYVNR